jgi:hypothetical protein
MQCDCIYTQRARERKSATVQPEKNDPPAKQKEKQRRARHPFLFFQISIWQKPTSPSHRMVLVLVSSTLNL